MTRKRKEKASREHTGPCPTIGPRQYNQENKGDPSQRQEISNKVTFNALSNQFVIEIKTLGHSLEYIDLKRYLARRHGSGLRPFLVHQSTILYFAQALSLLVRHQYDAD